MIPVILAVLGVLWLIYGAGDDKDNPAAEENDSRWNSKIEMKRRQYTNVVQENAVKTTKHSVSGRDSGLGGGGAAQGKS
jgi:hypothetical protein